MAEASGRMRVWAIVIAGAFVVITLLAVLQSSDTAPAPNVSGRAANLAIFDVADDPYLGDPAAPVVLVEFASPACSNCRAFHVGALPRIVEEYVETGDVVYYYVHARLGYDWEMDAAQAQECAWRHGDRGLFWAVTDALYAPANFSYSDPPDFRELLSEVAARSGGDPSTALQCFDEGEAEEAVRDDWRVAGEVGVRATPTFFVFGTQDSAVAVHTAGLDTALAAAIQSEQERGA